MRSTLRWRIIGAVGAAAGLATLIGLAAGLASLGTSWRGVIATGATVALVAGLEFAPRSPLGRLLGIGQVRYLGRISYATYLWHWPLSVFAVTVLEVAPWTLAILVGTTATGLAALSDQLIESPLRDGRLLRGRPLIVVTFGLAASVVVAVALVPAVLHNPARPALVERVVAVVANPTAEDTRSALDAALAAAPPTDVDPGATEPPPFDRGACSSESPDGCIVATGTGNHIHLLGDSNMQVLVPVFLALSSAHDLTVSVTTWPGCPWQLGLAWDDPDPSRVEDCLRHRSEWYDAILPDLSPDLIVIANTARDDSPGASAPYALADGSPPARGDVAAATAHSLDRLTAIAGDTPVVLLEPLPYGDHEPNNCLAAALTVAECAYTAPTEPSTTEHIYRTEDSRRTTVASIDYDDLACPYLPTCLPAIEGQLVFRNRNHLSNAWIVPRADELWRRVTATGLTI